MMFVVAAENLQAGDHVTIRYGFKAYKSLDVEKTTGVVPYSIKVKLKPGDRFWLTIKGDE